MNVPAVKELALTHHTHVWLSWREQSFGTVCKLAEMLRLCCYIYFMFMLFSLLYPLLFFGRSINIWFFDNFHTHKHTHKYTHQPSSKKSKTQFEKSFHSIILVDLMKNTKKSTAQRRLASLNTSESLNIQLMCNFFFVPLGRFIAVLC